MSQNRDMVSTSNTFCAYSNTPYSPSLARSPLYCITHSSLLSFFLSFAHIIPHLLITTTSNHVRSSALPSHEPPPLAFTAPPPPVLDVDCGFLPARPVDISDCILLLADLNSRPTTSQLIVYGRGQHAPGNVPQTISHGTCTIRIEYFPFLSRSTTDKFRLIDWKDSIQGIQDECLGPGKGYSSGAVLIGPRQRFFAYLGGHQLNRVRGNETLAGSHGEVEA